MRPIDADALIAEYDRVHVGAPGGVWKLEAKRNISDYLSAELKDLIEAGRVIVMM